GFACASTCECHGNGRGADVVGHLRDQYDVVISEGEPGVLDLAAELFDGGSYCLDSVLWLLDESFPAFTGIRNLKQVIRHTLLLGRRIVHRQAGKSKEELVEKRLIACRAALSRCGTSGSSR